MVRLGEARLNRLAFILFLLPIGTGLVQRVAKPNHWFRDFDAFSCAAARLGHRLPLYTNAIPCPRQKPTIYVYPPYLARLWEALQHAAGLSGATALYGGLYFFLLIYLLRLFISGKLVTSGEPGWMRAPLLVTIGTGLFTCGNIAVIIHGLIALAAIILWEYPILTMTLIVLAAAVKPVFLVYAVLFLFHPMNWRKKFAYGAATIILGLAPLLYFKFHDSVRFAHEMKLIGYFTLVNDRGVGFLNLTGLLGLAAFGPLMAVLYGMFVSVLILCGFSLCVLAEATARERLWIGITIAIFADPRLMFYDFLTVAPGIVCLIGLSQRLGERFHRLVRGYGVAICLACLILNSRGGQSGLYVFVPAFYALFVIIGGAFISRNRLRLSFIGRLPVRA